MTALAGVADIVVILRHRTQGDIRVTRRRRSRNPSSNQPKPVSENIDRHRARTARRVPTPGSAVRRERNGRGGATTVQAR